MSDLLNAEDLCDRTIVRMMASEKMGTFAQQNTTTTRSFQSLNETTWIIIAFHCDKSLYAMLPGPFSRVFRGLGHETEVHPSHLLQHCHWVHQQPEQESPSHGESSGATHVDKVCVCVYKFVCVCLI